MRGQKSLAGFLKKIILFMNYQLLIESYSLGSPLSEQEIELLDLELETQIMNINISTEFGCFKSAPSHICESLNLKKDTYWIMCLAEILDLHKPLQFGKTKSVEVFDLLLEKGLVIYCKFILWDWDLLI